MTGSLEKRAENVRKMLLEQVAKTYSMLREQTPTHAYCPECDDIRLADFEFLTAGSKSGPYVGGDVVCHECHTVIATVYREKGT